MFCTKCGKDNAEGNSFCIECGSPLKKPNIVQEQPEEEQTQDAYVPQEVSGESGNGSDKDTTILGDDTKVILTRQDGQEFKLSSFPVCLGKGSTADCIIDGDESISRQHACIHENGSEGFVIEDMNSSNKTYLNGNPLEPEELVVIDDGDEIKMGCSIFNVTIC